MKKIKISELPISNSLQGLFTIGTDEQNRSVKVSMEFIEQAANNANNAANEAEAAIEQADAAEEARSQAFDAAQSQRAQSYIEAEVQRDERYAAAEQTRNTNNQQAENVRNTTFDVAEQAREQTIANAVAAANQSSSDANSAAMLANEKGELANAAALAANDAVRRIEDELKTVCIDFQENADTIQWTNGYGKAVHVTRLLGVNIDHVLVSHGSVLKERHTLGAQDFTIDDGEVLTLTIVRTAEVQDASLTMAFGLVSEET